MQRYLFLFGAASIRCLLADREFIGVDGWISSTKNIPFAIRLRIDMTPKAARAWTQMLHEVP